MSRLIFTCILFIGLLVHSEEILGQSINVPTKINTPYGKVTIPNRVPAPWMKFNHYYPEGYSNQTHKFYIVLLNDSVIKVNAIINIEDSVHYLAWGKKKKTIITPKETKKIYRLNKEKVRLIGTPHDSCWLFPVDWGKIRTYSVTSDIVYPLIAYIQKGNEGSILPLTKENLLTMVIDNEEAVKLTREEKLLDAITVYNEY